MKCCRVWIMDHRSVYHSFGWRRSWFSRMTRNNHSHISSRSNSLILGIQQRKPSLLTRICQWRAKLDPLTIWHRKPLLVSFKLLDSLPAMGKRFISHILWFFFKLWICCIICYFGFVFVMERAAISYLINFRVNFNLDWFFSVIVLSLLMWFITSPFLVFLS